jgi:hypothetical protein
MTPTLYFLIGFILLVIVVFLRGMEVHKESDPAFYVSWLLLWPIWLVFLIPCFFFLSVFELGKKLK